MHLLCPDLDPELWYSDNNHKRKSDRVALSGPIRGPESYSASSMNNLLRFAAENNGNSDSGLGTRTMIRNYDSAPCTYIREGLHLLYCLPFHHYCFYFRDSLACIQIPKEQLPRSSLAFCLSHLLGLTRPTSHLDTKVRRVYF